MSTCQQVNMSSFSYLSTCKQEYVQKMRQHLAIATNPYNATMEIVMPGVQERFNGLNTTVQHIQNTNMELLSSNQELKAAIAELSSKADKNHNPIVTLHQQMNESTQNLVHAHTQGMRHTARLIERCNAFQPRDHPNLIDLQCVRQQDTTMNTSNNGENNNGENHESQSPQQCPNPSIPSPAIPNKPTISQRFKTLSLMWDEWHGTGGPDTMDKPIPGGFHQLEECYQNKRRKHLQGAQLRHYTRIRLIVDGIMKMARATNVAVESLCDELEPEWKKMKQSPDAMIKYLQAKGHLKKSKPRGRKSTTSNDA